MKQPHEWVLSDARTALDGAGARVGPEGGTPRFELFHAANSICSQKVRTVLAHRGLAYISRPMNLFTGQTYLPAYVRLRMLGCDSLGGALMSEHTGSTSVTAGGCDAAVVPTLVDLDTGRVIVDSKRICFHLDEIADGTEQLRPTSLATQIDAELDVIDNLPNYQMLSGRPPGDDLRPVSQRGKTGVEFAMSKVRRCDEYLAQCAEDDTLVRAYSAKRAKELDAADRLFSNEAMRTVYERAAAACAGLEQRLHAGCTHWLLAETVTMADLYWGIELLRMKNLGADLLWANGARPAVAAFAERTAAISSIRSAVVEWPGALF